MKSHKLLIGLVVLLGACSDQRSEGPSDQIIREKLKPTEITNIVRGDTMQATGESAIYEVGGGAVAIPKDTYLFPVRVKEKSDQGESESKYYFWQDEFHEWHCGWTPQA